MHGRTAQDAQSPPDDPCHFLRPIGFDTPVSFPRHPRFLFSVRPALWFATHRMPSTRSKGLPRPLPRAPAWKEGWTLGPYVWSPLCPMPDSWCIGALWVCRITLPESPTHVCCSAIRCPPVFLQRGTASNQFVALDTWIPDLGPDRMLLAVRKTRLQRLYLCYATDLAAPNRRQKMEVVGRIANAN